VDRGGTHPAPDELYLDTNADRFYDLSNAVLLNTVSVKSDMAVSAVDYPSGGLVYRGYRLAGSGGKHE